MKILCYNLFFVLELSGKLLLIYVRNLHSIIDYLVLAESLIEVHLLKDVEQIPMLGSISVVYEYELLDSRNTRELLLEVVIQLFADVSVDVYDALVLLQLGNVRQIRYYLVVEVIDIRLLPNVEPHIIDELLHVEHIEVLEIDYELFQLIRRLRCNVYVHYLIALILCSFIGYLSLPS